MPTKAIRGATICTLVREIAEPVKDLESASIDALLERIFHESEVPAFVLHLRDPRRPAIREELLAPRLQRAIEVVYRPQTELQSHYFHASLSRQFDELVWFDETQAVEPLGVTARRGAEFPETYPFGL